MGLIQENIKVKVNNFNKEHFEALGYIVNFNSYIDIKVNELPIGSGLKIKVKCDYCGKEFDKAYRRYLETKDDICCDECKTQKMQDTTLERYGNKCSLRNADVALKTKATNLRKIGVENPFQSSIIREKIKNTMMERYSVFNTAESPELRAKMNKTMKYKYSNKAITTSKQQLYLHNLYGGELNYNISRSFIDIFFKENNICCEYNGGGHNLSVIHGRCTQEEFDIKERAKNISLINAGYKCFTIISTKDKLPSDIELLEIKQRAIYNLIDKNNDIYIYDIENKSEKTFKV